MRCRFISSGARPDKPVTDPAWQGDVEQFAGVGMRPYAPCQLRAIYASGDLALSWIRRGRSPGSDSWDQTEIPMSETAESYDVEILDAMGAVKRTFPGISVTSVTYTVSEIAGDFPSGLPSPFRFVAYQLSSVVGRGSGGKQQASSSPKNTTVIPGRPRTCSGGGKGDPGGMISTGIVRSTWVPFPSRATARSAGDDSFHQREMTTMTDTTPRTGAPLLAAAQAQKHVTHNEALYQFDAFLCARFLDRDLTAPPSTPSDGDTYLVKATATGGWTGQSGKIAYCADGAWRFYAPFGGLVAYVADESKLIVYTGSAWVDYASLMVLQNVPLIGVNTTATAPNLLTVESNAVLFTDVPTGSGGTGDVRATLSKQAAANTASFLFQDNFSGRAEIGLAGDDNFHFKVSPDGSTWHDAIIVTASSGLATLASATITSADINGGTVDGTSIGASATSSGAFTTLSASAAATFSPANANVTLSPTGTGSVAIAPATAGAINNMTIGAATPAAAVFTSLQSNGFKDGKTTAVTTVQVDTAGRLLVGPNGGFSTALNVGGNIGGFQIARHQHRRQPEQHPLPGGRQRGRHDDARPFARHHHRLVRGACRERPAGCREFRGR